MRWVRLAGRIFLVTGAIFGVVEGWIHRSASIGAAAGLIFGALMALTLTGLTALRTRGDPDRCRQSIK